MYQRAWNDPIDNEVNRNTKLLTTKEVNRNTQLLGLQKIEESSQGLIHFSFLWKMGWESCYRNLSQLSTSKSRPISS